MGDAETESRTAGAIEIVLACVLPFNVAVIVEDAAAVPATVVTLNLPTVPPMATDTVEATVAALEEEVSDTATAPLPDPGTALSVTTPATIVPPLTEEGVSVSPVTWNGDRVTVVVLLTPPYVAVIVTVCVVVTRL